ncbi:uncharacterized protein RHO17_026520 [Thomomys bottae]
MPARPAGAQKRLGGSDLHPTASPPPSVWPTLSAGVKVQEEVQPLPSFLRSEHTEPGAAAPPLRHRLRPALGRAHLFRRRCPPASAAAATRLGARARTSAPVRAPSPPPSPFVSSAPAPPPRLALCRGRSARPQRAREKPRSARACAAGRSSSASSSSSPSSSSSSPCPPLLLPACARPSWPGAGAA